MTKKIQVVQFDCKKCGYSWIGRTKKPKQCPKCKNPKWLEKKQNGKY